MIVSLFLWIFSFLFTLTFPGYPLNSKMTKQNLIDLEQTVRSVLEQNFAGTYHSLPEMTEEFRKDLVDRHFMFEDCDR